MRVVGEDCGQRPAEHVAHAQIEQRDEEDDGDDQARLHGAGRSFELLGGRLHARCACRGGSDSGGVRERYRSCAVAGTVNGAADDVCAAGGVVVIDGHGTGEQVDRNVRHAGNVFHGALYMRLACRARHASNVEFLVSHGRWLPFYRCMCTPGRRRLHARWPLSICFQDTPTPRGCQHE